MVRHIALSVVLGATLSGCVSVDHLSSQRRLDSGIAALQEAEKFDRATSEATSAKGLKELGSGLPASAESLRRALAEDAQADIDAAKNGLSGAQPEDRISALSRAGLKAWQAGEAGTRAAETVQVEGKQLCGNVKTRPQRDCEVFSVVAPLNALEVQADKLLVFDAKRVAGSLGVEDAAPITNAVNRISAEVVGLGAIVQNDRVELIKNWVARQRAIYVCIALSGNAALAVIDAEVKTKSVSDVKGPLTQAMASINKSHPNMFVTKRFSDEANKATCRTLNGIATTQGS